MRRALSREALTVVAFSGLQLVLGLASTRLLTQLAAPEALGEYYLYMNLATWLILPVSSSFLYLWKTWTLARATGQGPRLAASIVRGLGWQAVICGVGSAVLGAIGIVHAPPLVLVALAITSIGQAVNVGLDPLQMLERHRVVSGVLGLLSTPVRWAVLSLGVVLVARTTGASLLWTQAAYGVATAALSAWLFRRTVLSPYRGEPGASQALAADELGARRFLGFALPFLVTGIATQAAASAERWGLALRADAGATALFVQAVAVSLAAVSAVSMPISTYFAPIISQAAASTPGDPLRGASRPLRRFIVLSTVAIAATAAGVGAFSGPITGILFGPRYHDIAVLLPWAILAQAFFGISQAVALVPISVDATVSASAALVGSKAVYLVLLLVVPSSSDWALMFVKCFALGNLLYLVGMIAAAARTVRLRRARVARAVT